MGAMRDIKRRIKSVTSIRQITRAMKMVAAAKLNRAQSRMLAMRPYAHEMERVLLRILPELGELDHPLLVEREKPQKIGILVISSDRGLCAGFNTNLVRKVHSFQDEHAGKEIKFIAVGKKINRFLARGGGEIVGSHVNATEDLTYSLADKISQKASDEFCKGNIHELYLIYNEFKSVMTQSLVVKKVLPFDIVYLKSLIPPAERAARTARIFEYEPQNTEEFAGLLLPRYLSTTVYRALLESYASELCARMTAMDNATKNAEDMIFSLSLTFNKARQAAITKEITEIVGGAEALRG